MKPLAPAAVALVIACAGAYTAAPSDADTVPTVSAKCKKGSRAARIAGKRVCLRVGQRCQRRHDARYHRYGFHCHGTRLAPRRRRTAPPPPPPPPGPRPNTIRIDVGAEPNGVAAGYGAIWVASRAARLVRVGPATNRVTGTFPLPGRTCAAGGIGVGFGSLWISHCEGTQGTSRIDPATGAVVATLTDVSADAFGFGFGSVWAPSLTGDALARINPATNQVVTRIPVGRTPVGVRVDFGSVWVTNRDAGTVSRVDPATNTVVATIPVGGGPTYLQTGDGALWVTSEFDRRLHRIDPATNAATPIDLRTGPVDPSNQGQITIAVAAGSVWVRGSRVLVSRVDTRTNEVVERFAVGSGGGGLVFSDGSLWAAAYGEGSLWRMPYP